MNEKKIVSLHTPSNDDAKLIIPDDAEVCQNCTHLYRDSETAKQGACRRYPPSVLPIPQPHPITGQMTMTLQSLSPPVTLDYWCGDFEPENEPPID